MQPTMPSEEVVKDVRNRIEAAQRRAVELGAPELVKILEYSSKMFSQVVMLARVAYATQEREMVAIEALRAISADTTAPDQGLIARRALHEIAERAKAFEATL